MNHGNSLDDQMAGVCTLQLRLRLPVAIQWPIEQGDDQTKEGKIDFEWPTQVQFLFRNLDGSEDSVIQL